MPSPMHIARYVQEQLSSYNYTFPVSVTYANVSI